MPFAIILFRNDLRLADNPAIHHALSQGKKILPVFIYEDHFHNGNEVNFERLGAATKLWLHYSLKSLSESVSEYGSKLLILKGNQKVVLNALIDKVENSINSVYWNRRYEPHHIKLDTELKEFLTHKADENAETEARGQLKDGTVEGRTSSRLRRTNDRSVRVISGDAEDASHVSGSYPSKQKYKLDLSSLHEDHEDDENAEIGVREQCQEAINLAYQGSIELIDLIYATQANDEIVTKIAEPGLELLHSPKFLRQFIRSLVLSGMAMYYANNSSPCSGSEHMISHAIDAIYGHGVKAAHGIQVAIASYFIYPQQLEVLKKINQTPERIINFEELFTLLKLPKSFQEIGVSSKELDYVLKLAPKTRANKFSILNLKDDRLKISN